MKINKVLLTLTLVFAAWAQIQAAPIDQKKLIGKWQYTAPTAPPNYMTGQINFLPDGDKLKGELEIEGQKLAFSEVILKNDEVEVTIVIEATPITIKFKLVKDKLEGKAETPDGIVEVTAIRK
jgi:hypothetical protein